jgi:hypothetical protein
MAEQLTREQAFRNAGAVDGDKGAVATAASVYLLGDEFLPGAALAADQYGHAQRRHLQDVAAQLDHRFGLPEQKPATPVGRWRQVARRRRQLPVRSLDVDAVSFHEVLPRLHPTPGSSAFRRPIAFHVAHTAPRFEQSKAAQTQDLRPLPMVQQPCTFEHAMRHLAPIQRAEAASGCRTMLTSAAGPLCRRAGLIESSFGKGLKKEPVERGTTDRLQAGPRPHGTPRARDSLLRSGPERSPQVVEILRRIAGKKLMAANRSQLVAGNGTEAEVLPTSRS